MGLDITAYSRLDSVGRHTETPWCDDENHVIAYAYADFPASFAGIPILGDNKGKRHGFLVGGCYELTNETRTHRFRAGSYSGYNYWRSDLQKQFNPDRDPDGPFYELIWFADNEGTIGPVAARNLLADFREHADRYAPPEGDMDRDWDRQKYVDWTRAMELATDGGLVDFH